MTRNFALQIHSRKIGWVDWGWFETEREARILWAGLRWRPGRWYRMKRMTDGEIVRLHLNIPKKEKT